MRPLCECGNLAKIRSSGRGYSKLCNSCERKKYKLSRVGYRQHKKDTCERCGFIPEHKCQLDVHHKDGNHKNNSADNLQTLCANCHRFVHI